MPFSKTHFVLLPLIGLCAFAGWHWSDMNVEISGGADAVDLVELWRMGDSEEDDVLFRSIDRIAVDSRGHIYVVEYDHPAVRVFSSAGDLIREIGREGMGTGEFSNPFDVVIGEADTVFVWDTYSAMRRIAVFSPHDYDVVTTLTVQDDLAFSSPSRLVGMAPEGFLLRYTTTFYQDERKDLKLDSPRFVDVYLANRRGEMLERRLAPVPDKTMVVTRRRGSLAARFTRRLLGPPSHHEFQWANVFRPQRFNRHSGPVRRWTDATGHSMDARTRAGDLR